MRNTRVFNIFNSIFGLGFGAECIGEWGISAIALTPVKYGRNT